MDDIRFFLFFFSQQILFPLILSELEQLVIPNSRHSNFPPQGGFPPNFFPTGVLFATYSTYSTFSPVFFPPDSDLYPSSPVLSVQLFFAPRILRPHVSPPLFTLAPTLQGNRNFSNLDFQQLDFAFFFFLPVFYFYFWPPARLTPHSCPTLNSGGTGGSESGGKVLRTKSFWSPNDQYIFCIKFRKYHSPWLSNSKTKNKLNPEVIWSTFFFYIFIVDNFEDWFGNSVPHRHRLNCLTHREE